jgi:hypothetical protein
MFKPNKNYRAKIQGFREASGKKYFALLSLEPLNP